MWHINLVRGGIVVAKRMNEQKQMQWTAVPEHLLSAVLTLLQNSSELLDSHKATIGNVYLFGSRAYAVDSPDSDFDLIALVLGIY